MVENRPPTINRDQLLVLMACGGISNMFRLGLLERQGSALRFIKQLLAVRVRKNARNNRAASEAETPG